MIITSVMMIMIEVAGNAIGQNIIDGAVKQEQGVVISYNTKLGLCPRIFLRSSCPKPYELDDMRRL